MTLLCRLKGHWPAPDLVWNEGRHFSHCRRCGVPLMRSARMVWRTTAADEFIETSSEGLPRLVKAEHA